MSQEAIDYIRRNQRIEAVKKGRYADRNFRERNKEGFDDQQSDVTTDNLVKMWKGDALRELDTALSNKGTPISLP